MNTTFFRKWRSDRHRVNDAACGIQAARPGKVWLEGGSLERRSASLYLRYMQLRSIM